MDNIDILAAITEEQIPEPVNQAIENLVLVLYDMLEKQGLDGVNLASAVVNSASRMVVRSLAKDYEGKSEEAAYMTALMMGAAQGLGGIIAGNIHPDGQQDVTNFLGTVVVSTVKGESELLAAMATGPKSHN